MYYVAHGSLPRQRHTQHRAPGRQPLRRGALRRRGLHRPELDPLPPRPADADLQDRARPPGRARGGRRRPPPPSADEDRRRCQPKGDAISGRIPLYFNNDVVFGSSGPPSRCPPGRSTATASPTRCSTSTRVRASATRSSVRCATVPATTSCCRSARPGGSIPTRARSSGSSTSRRRPRSSRLSRYRNDYGQLLEHSPYSQRDIHAPDDVRAAVEEHGEFVIHVRSSGPDHRLSLSPSPVRCRRLGRLPVAVPLQHRRLPADHRTGPPAAARASDVPGAEFRRLLVRAAQVRLPPAGDPGALQPLEHQQRRGHLLRRRATS